MAYSEKLAERINSILKGKRGIVQKKMFGGICYMYKDKMSVGIVKDDLMIRVLPEKYDGYLKKPHVRKMDFTGKPLKGFLYVGSQGIKTEKQLSKWIDVGLEFAVKSPPKKTSKKTRKKTTKKAVKKASPKKKSGA